MSDVARLKVNWTGTSGGAGFSTLHVERGDHGTITVTNLNNAFSRLRLMFENTSEWLPNDVTVSFPAAVDIIDSATGDLTNVVTASSPASSIPGAFTGNWQNGVGTRIAWQTGQIAGGRRVRGFTYLVPYGGIFDVDGTLSAAAAADVLGAATGLISGLVTDSMLLGVYSHLRHLFYSVSSASVSDKPVILRTRRD